MGTNKIENPCSASGCVGACCYNVAFTNVTGEQLETLTPDGTNVVYVPLENFPLYVRSTSAQIRREGAANVPQTVYVAPTPNKATYSVLVAGACPNLQPDNSCGVYDKRPPQCELFNYGGKPCNSARESLGVPKLIARTIQRRPGL